MIDESAVEMENGSLLIWDEIVDSPSFPNLTTQYRMHQLAVSVTCCFICTGPAHHVASHGRICKKPQSIATCRCNYYQPRG